MSNKSNKVIGAGREFDKPVAVKPAWKSAIENATSAIAELDRQLVAGGDKTEISKLNSQPVVTVGYVNAHVKYRVKQGYVFDTKDNHIQMVDFVKVK